MVLLQLQVQPQGLELIQVQQFQPQMQQPYLQYQLQHLKKIVHLASPQQQQH